MRYATNKLSVTLVLLITIVYVLPTSTQGFVSLGRGEIYELIDYQGKLTTPEGIIVDTTVSIQFTIYSDSLGGDSLWAETHPSVKVDHDTFNVLLGIDQEIPESVYTRDAKYLGVKIGNEREIVPRRPIVHIPYDKPYDSNLASTKVVLEDYVPGIWWSSDTSETIFISREFFNMPIHYRKPDNSCLVQIFIDRNGKVRDARIHRDSGAKTGLEAVVLEMAKERKFAPSTYEGQPVAVWTVVTYSLVPEDYFHSPGKFVSYDELPKFIERVEPKYPPKAKKKRIEGKVWVQVLVDKEGKAADVRIYKDSGTHAGFEEAAIEAAKACQFTPAIADGKPIESWVVFLYHFKLR